MSRKETTGDAEAARKDARNLNFVKTNPWRPATHWNLSIVKMVAFSVNRRKLGETVKNHLQTVGIAANPREA
jgi:hypothetical protein